jgi:hypothetical protein
MGLKVIVDSIDDLNDNLKGLYKKSGDKYLLDLNNVNEHPAVSGLSKTMREERDARKKFEKSLKEIQKKADGLDLDALKDIDIDEYKSNIADLEKFKKELLTRNKKKLKDKEQWEKLEKQLQDQNKLDIDDVHDSYLKKVDSYKQKLEEITTSKDTEMKTMLKSLESHLKDKEIISALAEAKGNVPVLMPHISKFVKVIKNSADEYVSSVIDSEGTQRITDTGEPMTISEFVTELKNKPEFKGEGIFAKETKPGGSGSPGNQSGETGNDEHNPFTKEHFNLTQQMKLKRSNPAEFDRLQAAAG